MTSGIGLPELLLIVLALVIGVLIVRRMRLASRTVRHVQGAENGDFAGGADARHATSSVPISMESLSGKRQNASIFICYRRGVSNDITGRIYDRLVLHFGKACVFKDVDNIPLGIDFRRHLEDSVSQCDILLAIIGSDWQGGLSSHVGIENERDFVRIEIDAALRRGIPIIPILVLGAEVPREEDLPETLRPLCYRQGVAVRSDPDFHYDVDRLVRGIKEHISRSATLENTFGPARR